MDACAQAPLGPCRRQQNLQQQGAMSKHLVVCQFRSSGQGAATGHGCAAMHGDSWNCIGGSQSVGRHRLPCHHYPAASARHQPATSKQHQQQQQHQQQRKRRHHVLLGDTVHAPLYTRKPASPQTRKPGVISFARTLLAVLLPTPLRPCGRNPTSKRQEASKTAQLRTKAKKRGERREARVGRTKGGRRKADDERRPGATDPEACKKPNPDLVVERYYQSPSPPSSGQS